MRKVLLALALVMGLASTAVAQVDSLPPMLSLQRLAGGMDARALWIGESSQFHFDPAAWLSYSLANNLSASVVQGWNTDKGVDPIRVGLRMYIPNDPVRVALGVNYLYDWRADSLNGAWSVGLYGGWILQKSLAATASAERIFPTTADLPTRDEFRIGLRAKFFGGR